MERAEDEEVYGATSHEGLEASSSQDEETIDEFFRRLGGSKPEQAPNLIAMAKLLSESCTLLLSELDKVPSGALKVGRSQCITANDIRTARRLVASCKPCKLHQAASVLSRAWKALEAQKEQTATTLAKTWQLIHEIQP